MQLFKRSLLKKLPFSYPKNFGKGIGFEMLLLGMIVYVLLWLVVFFFFNTWLSLFSGIMLLGMLLWGRFCRALDS